MLESIKKVDKKILMMIGVLFAVIIVFVVAILVISLTSSGKMSYSKIEKKMTSAAKSYYKKNNDLLPTDIGKSIEVDADTLAMDGYLKDLSEYTADGVVCTGKVIVAKTYNEYDYVPALDCGDDYKTDFLADRLIAGAVTSGNGLYNMDDFVVTGSPLDFDEDGYDLSTNELMHGYVFRGEIVNNYISIDGVDYRIVKIDENKDIMLVYDDKIVRNNFDDRYNVDIEHDYGINNYAMSRAQEKITSVYNSLKDKSLVKTKGVAKNICVGSRSDDDLATDGSIECASVMKSQYYGLLPVYDIMNASLSSDCHEVSDVSCTNYNYLTTTPFWTMTPSSDNTYETYIVSNSGIKKQRSSTSSILKYVVFLSNRVIYSGGDGTEDNPYTIR